MFIYSILTLKQPLTIGVRIAVFFSDDSEGYYHAAEVHIPSPDFPSGAFSVVSVIGTGLLPPA